MVFKSGLRQYDAEPDQVLFLATFPLMINATIDVPTKVADQYSHKLPNTPESKAGANERAGFIDAPEINAKKKISNPTIPPIAIPPNPLNPLVYTTKKITAIRRADANTSIPKTIVQGSYNLAHLHLGWH
jgi:hypothetical protein